MRYDYCCAECGKIEEKWHSIKEDPEYFCEDHDEPVLMKRVITGGAGTIYRGQGWASKNNATAGEPKKITTKALVGKPRTPDPRKTLKKMMEK